MNVDNDNDDNDGNDDSNQRARSTNKNRLDCQSCKMLMLFARQLLQRTLQSYAACVSLYILYYSTGYFIERTKYLRSVSYVNFGANCFGIADPPNAMNPLQMPKSTESQIVTVYFLILFCVEQAVFTGWDLFQHYPKMQSMI